MKQHKVMPLILAIIVILAGCGKKIDYTLPDNPIEFNLGTFTNPMDTEDSYGSIEYNGRTYIGYGTQKGTISGKDLGECLGYIVQDGEKIEDSRVFLLAGDTDANFLGEFSTVTLMDPTMFYRAVDTLGMDITIPDFVDDLGYDYWKNVASEGADNAAVEESLDTEDTTTAADITLENDTSETQRSPFDIWEYEGYVDECDGYIWREEFFDCDYDGDGKPDRVDRSWDGKEQTAIYTIEFGNGERLVTPAGWETGFPHIQSGDLDGDGAKEILVTLTYDTSTDPYSFGDMWLFDRNESTGEYSEVELPLVNAGENGAKGFEMEYDKPEDGKITFTMKGAGLTKTEEVGEDYISTWWSDEAVPEMRCVFYAEIKNDSNPVLRCYIAPLHRWSLILGFNLNYRNGKYEIGYIEIDEPDGWE